MLPRSARLTTTSEFTKATKSGHRFSSPSLVTYLYLTKKEHPAKCGLIISKNTGGSVVRHRISRQIRHSLKGHLTALPSGSLLVVRSLPSASQKSGRELSKEIAGVLPQLIRKIEVGK